MTKEQRAQGIVTCPCRCGGELHFAEEIGSARALILHSLPPCKWYLDTDETEEFERELRKHPVQFGEFVKYHGKGALS